MVWQGVQKCFLQASHNHNSLDIHAADPVVEKMIDGKEYS